MVGGIGIQDALKEDFRGLSPRNPFDIDALLLLLLLLPPPQPLLIRFRRQSLGWEDPLEKEMAAHSSTLAWKIPWTEEPGRLQSMGSHRVGHD